MNIEELYNYCLSKQGASEHLPFDNTTLVFKVGNKMFALFSLEWEELKINLKCEPEQAIILREQYPNVITPGYHMNKKHWNTVLVEGVSTNLLKKLIDDSYELIVQSLSKKQQAKLKQ